MLLVSLSGPRHGEPLAPVGVRRMLGRAGVRADLGPLLPHSFRHQFTNDVRSPKVSSQLELLSIAPPSRRGAELAKIPTTSDA
jgi:hypothetical protein